MKVASECYQCLGRLVRRVADLSTSGESLRAEAISTGLKIVDDNFSYDVISIAIATKIHQAIKEITGNPDPYRGMKDEEMRISREVFEEISSTYTEDFKGCLALSVLGNAIDFFRDFDSIKEDMRGTVKFSLDDSSRYEEKLKDAKAVLFLADNAGEVFFDLPLVQWMGKFAKVTYVVKESPVQNDLTLEDLRRSGLEGEFDAVTTTGTATPGVILSLASAQFNREFESADLILAKGMGYYEGLTELPSDGRVMHCLKAKCKPVADSLGVPLNSYVAVLR
ncbi:MAG: ARMT1-like domain-containing protein [Dehalococcoidia bacterium]